MKVRGRERNPVVFTDAPAAERRTSWAASVEIDASEDARVLPLRGLDATSGRLEQP
jgi:hypothetical protein